MTCLEYTQNLLKDYRVIRELANKPDSRCLILKHKTLDGKLVFKQFQTAYPLYDALKNIAFENLPLVYDAVTLDDGQVVLEEYVEGVMVADVVETGLYTYSGAKRVLTDVCDALQVIHSFGFVHRDVKPENIMISDSGIVKLIDFNASRRYSPTLTQDTIQLGTIGYASPEQLGLSQSDRRTDIYAMGVLLNVMLTGEHPSKKLAKGRAGKIILKCTQINPDSRFQTVEELKAAL